ncbi:siderophore-interacting protein [Leifsonia sp. ZF2019]|uniref:siderophore-interacting protein n=1 Tax=Leifsonia sp. ZF2019 TaxID=2781978 RepID=UPI001CBAA85C|nr:siderophore-interacting protein [Leifsonia sp. ZF2019]UAJ81051.1 siderophore-interacting protein [Leifsonia sp. ZF2019]
MTLPLSGSRPSRPARSQHVFEVVRTERLTPHLVRVVLGGAAFDAFVGEADPGKLATTDKYVKLLMAKPGLDLQPPYDLDALRAELPPEDVPVRRTYTVRDLDREAKTLTIDFVVHGDEGIAGPWAAAAQPGDLLALSGPGGMYAPVDDPGVEHLLIGDDSALPAVAAGLAGMVAEARGLVLIEVGGAADELELEHPAGVEVRWVHRGSAVAGEPLVEAVRALPEPGGRVQVFAHGERTAMKGVRAVLQGWGLTREEFSLSAYWALGRAEDTFQAEKRLPVGDLFA